MKKTSPRKPPAVSTLPRKKMAVAGRVGAAGKEIVTHCGPFTVTSIIQQPKSLLMVEYPPGFDSGGRRVLAECPEFRVVELYKVGGETELETAPEIERAYWRAIFRIKGSHVGPWSDETNRRIDWAIALKKMMRFKERGYTGSDVPLARALSETLGPAIKNVLESQDIEGGADGVSKMFRDAVLALAREDGKIKDGRAKLSIPSVAILIIEAQGIFQHLHARPTKSFLRERLEMIGYGIKGKDASARWRERFEQACLDKLPE